MRAVNEGFAQVIANRVWPEGYSMETFHEQQKALAADPGRALVLLRESAPKLAAAIGGVSDEELAKEIQMAWGPTTLEHMIAHGYWNMSYHEAQINYIAAILGVD